MRTARHLVVVASALAAAAGACGDPGGLTVVTVQARPAVHPVDKLALTLVNGNSTQTDELTVDGREFPLTFSVETKARAGELDIYADAHDAAGTSIAGGAIGLVLDPSGQHDVTLMLEPADFEVNTVFTGDQVLAFRVDAAGRQIAVAPTGVVTVGWSDSCQVVGRCDVFGRRFDPSGNPVATTIAAGTGQFNINLSNNLIGYEPSLATNRDGVTLATWSDGLVLLAVAIDAGGRALSTIETTLATATHPSTPAVTALPNGRFIVAWTEDAPAAGQFVVRARYVDAAGAATINPVTGTSDAYTVSTTAILITSPPAIVALGDTNAHAIVWRDDTTIRGRFYTPTGAARSGSDLVLAGYAATDSIGNPLVVAAVADIVIAHARRTTGGGDADTGEIVLRRLDVMGLRVGLDGVATRAAELAPVALASRPDGAVAAAWPACTTENDGAGCAVRVQVFRPTLAPVGAPLLANSTTVNDQLDPALAFLPDGSLFGAWSDASLLAPDQDGFGIRARILYPPYDDARGILGAHCDATPECGDGNVCIAGSDQEPRCYRACTDSCPLGGNCATVAGQRGCVF